MSEERRLIRDFPVIQTVLDLQNILYGLNKDNLVNSTKLIISMSPAMNHLARNLYRLSGLRRFNQQLFVELVLILKDKTEIEKALIENQKYVTNFDCESFVENLRSNGIKLPKLKSDIHETKIQKNDRIYDIIANDDINEFQHYCYENDLDINGRIICNLSPKYLFFEKSTNYLCLAAYYGAVKCFKYLIMNDANIKIGNLAKFAIAGGNCEIIRLVEQNGIIYDYNSISFAINMHNIEIYDWLMERFPGRLEIRESTKCEFIYGIQDTSVDDFKGFHAIQASNVGFKELAEIILLYSPFKPEFLNIALYYNYVEVAKALLQNPEVDVNWFSKEFIHTTYENFFYNYTPIYLACKNGMIDVVRELVSREDIDVNYIGGGLTDKEQILHRSPIIIAATKNRLDIVKVLLTHRDTKSTLCVILARLFFLNHGRLS